MASPVVFDAPAVALFREASLDRNPLHSSSDYARGTPFGDRVVFGILGVLRALAGAAPRPGQALSELHAEFLSPLFEGAEHTLELAEPAGDALVVTLSRGGKAALRVEARYTPIAEPLAWPEAPRGHAPEGVTQPADPSDADLAARPTCAGAWAPDWPLLRRLALELGLPERGLTPAALSALALSSYLVGMVLIGRRALYSSVRMRFGAAVPPGGALAFEAALRAFDKRFGLARAQLTVQAEGAVVATAEIESFVRKALPPPDVAGLAAALPADAPLRGKVALVVGGSRGIGARTAAALALLGCRTYASYHRSGDEVERLRAALAARGCDLRPLQGDAGDAAVCAALRAQIEAESGGLDVLVCCACPPLRAMEIRAETAAQIDAYVARSLSLVSAPLGAFLGSLGARGGEFVALSSTVVNEPVAEWPHYLAAKCAIEGLTRAAALAERRARFTLARPWRVRTDLTSSQIGLGPVLTPESVAQAIAAALLESLGDPGQGVVRLIERFPS